VGRWGAGALGAGGTCPGGDAHWITLTYSMTFSQSVDLGDLVIGIDSLRLAPIVEEDNGTGPEPE